MARYESAGDAVARQRAYPDLAADLVAHEFQRRRVRSCAAFVRPGDVVLEVGCNSGYFASFVPQAEVHGVDVNPDLVAIAATRLASARVAQAEALPFPDRSFDVVNVSGVLEQCHDPATILREAARVSRRSLTGTTTHASGTWGKHRIERHEWQSHSFTEAELRALLEPLGRIVELGTVDVNDPPEPQCWFWCVEVRG